MKHISYTVAKFVNSVLPEWVIGENMFVQNMPDVSTPYIGIVTDPALNNEDATIDGYVIGEVQVILRTNNLERDFDKAMEIWKVLRVTAPFETDVHRIINLRPKSTPNDYPASDAGVVEISVNARIRYFVKEW